MVISILLVILAAAGGFSLSFLYQREANFLWRTGAGIATGCAIFGTLLFPLGVAFGLGPVSITAAALITVSPLAIFWFGYRGQLEKEWRKAKGKLQGANARKILTFGFYAAAILIFILFFDRAYYETSEGIFTGASQNFGDLPFHLGAIFSFSDGGNFPPQNPSFAGATFSYPFVSDLFSAAAVRLGSGTASALLVPNVAWAFSLLILLVSFVKKLVPKTSWAMAGAAIFFFSGGLGFLWFLSDYFSQSAGSFDLLSHLPADYTINENFRWGNSLVCLFITQRSLLLGMPLTILVLIKMWDQREKAGEQMNNVGVAVAGLIAGTLVLIHLHSLAVLFVVSAVWSLTDLKDLKTWLIFGGAVCVTAVPELLWSLSGSATSAREFIAWNYGWDAGETNIFWFWLKNTGLTIPLAIAGIYIAVRQDTEKKKQYLIFYLPFLLIFLVCNAAKFAPWQWDNIKLLIYWFVASVPFIVLALEWISSRSKALQGVSMVFMLCLCASGMLDVWRTISRQIEIRVFDQEAVKLAEKMKVSTPQRTLILNAPTFNSAVVLSGRRSLMRYPGHLASHGIDHRQREAEVRTMYRGGPRALELMRQYGIEYVLISPPERADLGPDEAWFARFPVAAEAGRYRLYKIAQ